MNNIIPNYGQPLTWDQLADYYPGIARIQPMTTVFDWAAKQTDKFYVHPEDETIHLIIKEDDIAK